MGMTIAVMGAVFGRRRPLAKTPAIIYVTYRNGPDTESATRGVLCSGARVLGAFYPRRVDDLKGDAQPLVGRVGQFEALWKITDGETYAGEWAMKIPADWPIETAIWVPSGDVRLLSDR
jgi:hypothetical protein